MKIRLYLDEDTMDSDLVHAVRIQGVDVVTTLDVGMMCRDYQSLHTQYLIVAKSHAGIIVAQQQRYSVGEQMGRLLRLVASVPAD